MRIGLAAGNGRFLLYFSPNQHFSTLNDNLSHNHNLMREVQMPDKNNSEADEQAIAYLIAWLQNRIKRQPDGDERALEPYGFDLYRDLLREKLRIEPINPMDAKIVAEKLPFLNAIWDLCVRGILRPGTVTHSSTSGNYFAITSYGLNWLKLADLNESIPMEYGRFSQLLAHHNELFGEAYRVRTQEAVRCYEAHTYFACCAMCGAAAESILLTLAFNKISEQETLREYRQKGGRQRIRNRLVGQARNELQSRFDNYLELLNYWRDESAHGIARSIGEEESFTSLLLLLRFAQLGSNEWNTLTKNG